MSPGERGGEAPAPHAASAVHQDRRGERDVAALEGDEMLGLSVVEDAEVTRPESAARPDLPGDSDRLIGSWQ